jgi:hypothetical protein
MIFDITPLFSADSWYYFITPMIIAASLRRHYDD